MGMKLMLDSFGNPINAYVNDGSTKAISRKTAKPSKNALRKHARYGVPITYVDSYREPKKLDAIAKGKGILNEYYNFFDSHNDCMNPRTQLIRLGY
mgnify:CR=1 FL=1